MYIINCAVFSPGSVLPWVVGVFLNHSEGKAQYLNPPNKQWIFLNQIFGDDYKISVDAFAKTLKPPPVCDLGF